MATSLSLKTKQDMLANYEDEVSDGVNHTGCAVHLYSIKLLRFHCCMDILLVIFHHYWMKWK